MIDGLSHFFKYELELWQRVVHENVIKIFELFDDGTRNHISDGIGGGHPYIYLLMQYADMGTLGSVKEEDGTFEGNERIYERVRSIDCFERRYNNEVEVVARWIFR